eukprot:TRINITY_DN42306_c0_g1_i1.p1 TRINITY_DN42306_c0_g1~~TRINITY_DN42306_c0_g1_i1.p1  ORF type:complete len:205 (+),score=-11.27 TRINITY_DN42306_c0_g1_i1:568-1182(+)
MFTTQQSPKKDEKTKYKNEKKILEQKPQTCEQIVIPNVRRVQPRILPLIEKYYLHELDIIQHIIHLRVISLGFIKIIMLIKLNNGVFKSQVHILTNVSQGHYIQHQSLVRKFTKIIIINPSNMQQKQAIKRTNNLCVLQIKQALLQLTGTEKDKIAIRRLKFTLSFQIRKQNISQSNVNPKINQVQKVNTLPKSTRTDKNRTTT